MDVSSIRDAGTSVPIQEDTKMPPLPPPPPQPKLPNFELAIFTPVTEDLTQEMTDRPTDRIGRVKRMLNNIDKYQRDVHAGYYQIVAREKQRITLGHREAQQHRGKDGPSPADDGDGEGGSVADEEIEQIVCALDQDAVDDLQVYDMDTESELVREGMRLVFAAVEDGDAHPHGRKSSMRQLHQLVEEGLYHIEDFDADIAKMRKRWEGHLEKEERWAMNM